MISTFMHYQRNTYSLDTVVEAVEYTYDGCIIITTMLVRIYLMGYKEKKQDKTHYNPRLR